VTDSLDNMKQKIAKLCKQIEKERNIRILFAIENGSRAWRMDSKDSDYDVRYVYVRPIEDYLQLNQKPDVITTAFDENLKPHPVQGSLVDMSGFDVFKYAKLLASSNPTTIEWIISDIVYYGKQNKVFKNFAMKNFNPISLYFHYKSSSRNNYEKYIKSGNHVTHKKYLYAYRGLVNAKWIVHKGTVPPIVFMEALDGLKKYIPAQVASELKKIIKIKSSGKEKDEIQRLPVLDSYAERFLKSDAEAPAKRERSSLDALNKEIKKILKI
jgi:uncharacterized protein